MNVEAKHPALPRLPAVAAGLYAAAALVCAHAQEDNRSAATPPSDIGTPVPGTSEPGRGLPPREPEHSAPDASGRGERNGGTTTLPEHWLRVSPATIERKTLINSEGMKLGDVTGVVRHRKTGEISAVVSVGGFLGIGWLGGKEVTVQLKRMHLQGNNIVFLSSLTRGDLLARAKPYRSEDYVPLEGDTPLGQLAGVMPSPEETAPPSFEELDSDNDGLLTPSESRSELPLVESWDKYDTDGNNRLDRAEFGLFLQQREREKGKETPPDT